MENKSFLQKYILSKNSQTILEVDFSSEYSLREYRDFFVKDYLNLKSFIPGSGIISQFVFQFEEDKVVITKNHDLNLFEFSINEEKQSTDFFEYLNKKYGVLIDAQLWAVRVVDIQKNPLENLPRVINSLNAQIPVDASHTNRVDELKSAILFGKSEEEAKKIEKIIDNQKKIKELEKEVSAYQNARSQKEDLERKITEFNNEKKMMEEKKSSVEFLLNSRTRVAQEIEKLRVSVGRIISETEKVEKIQNRVNSLKTLKESQLNSIKNVIKTDESVLVAKELIILVVVQIVLALLAFLISSEPNTILIGMLSTFSLTTAILIINMNKSELSSIIIDESKIPSREDSQQEVQDDSSAFISSAMLRALEQELSNIDVTIKNRLGEKSLEEFQRELSLITLKESELKNAAESQLGVMSPEDYYKKRRELDILKIEQENLEYSEGENNIQEKVRELVELMDENPKNVEFVRKLPILVLNVLDKSRLNIEYPFIAIA